MANGGTRTRTGGPRSAAGKRRASRNALRHGLAAITLRAPAPVAQIERLAKLICGGDQDPALLETARAIAANEIALQSIYVQQIATIEWLHDATAIAFAKGESSLKVAKARFRKSKMADKFLKAQIPVLIEKYKDKLPAKLKPGIDSIIPLDLEMMMDEGEPHLAVAAPIEQETWPFAHEQKERDEGEAIEEAARDLIRLDRYQRRAWSRQKRAIRAFISSKVTREWAEPSLKRTGIRLALCNPVAGMRLPRVGLCTH